MSVEFATPPKIPAFTPGSILYAGVGGVVSQDPISFFYDATLNRLGMGTAAPSYSIDIIGGSVRATYYFASIINPATVRSTYATQSFLVTHSRNYVTATQQEFRPANVQFDYIASAINGATFVGLANIIQDTPRNNYTALFVSPVNELYFGDTVKWTEVGIYLGTPAQVGGVYVWEYSTGPGTWATLTPLTEGVAGAASFSHPVSTLAWVSWADPGAAWVTATINAQAGKYWIRVRATTIPSVPVQINAMSSSLANGYYARWYVGALEKFRISHTGRLSVAGLIFPGSELQGNIVQGSSYFGYETGGIYTNTAFRVAGLAANGILYAGPTGLLTSAPTSLHYDPTLLYVGIGSNAPAYPLDVVRYGAAAENATIRIANFSASIGIPYLVFAKSRSNALNGLTNTVSGDFLAEIDFMGVAASNFSMGAALSVFAYAAPSTYVPTQMDFLFTSATVSSIRLSLSGLGVSFHGVAIAARPAAYTQTYAVAARTVPAFTQDTESVVYTGLATGLGALPYASVTDLNALRVAFENIRVSYEAILKVVNSLIDDGQGYGLLQ